MFWRKGIKFFQRIGVTLTFWYSLTIVIVTAIACIILYHRLHMKLHKQVNYTLKDDSTELALFLSRRGVTIEDFRGELDRETTTKRYFQMSGRLLSPTLEPLVVSDNFMLLFDVSSDFGRDLDKGVVSKYLRDGFQARGITLGQDLRVETQEPGGRWLIIDGDQRYAVRQAGRGLSIFYSSFTMSEETIANIKQGKRTLETTRFPHHRYQYRVRTLPVKIDGKVRYVVQLAIYLKYVDKTLENYLRNVSILLPCSFLISTIVGWLIARRGLSPIMRMSRAAQRITAARLDERLEVRGIGDELDELAETLNTMLDRLEKSFNHISQFTADVSHELRTPITTLRTATEVVLSGDQTVEAYRAHCEDCLENFGRLSRMVNDLLLLSRSEAGTEKPKMASVDMAQALRELQAPFSAVALSKNIELSFNLVGEAKVNGNTTLLRRLFSNLIDNALKYTAAGGRVDLDAKADADTIVVQLKDTGIGISQDNCLKIFDRFYRVDESRTRETGGTGLGLSICQCIAKLHGGTIEVESKLGVGTTFTVTLPKEN